MIVVDDDYVAELVREAERKASEQDPNVGWPDVIDTALGLLGLGLVPGLAIMEASKIVINAWKKARENGIRLLQVGRSDSSNARFPPGHPRDHVVYVGHPVMPEVYYPAASFHRVTFEHKFSEAIDLLMNLGATRMQVEHMQGWSREFGARTSLGIVNGKAGVDAEQKKQSRTSLLFEARLDGRSEPKLPNDLVWYHHEPTWKSVANGRLNFGLRDFSLSVTYDDDFSINADFKASAQKASLDLGGTFEDHVATTWKITGEFHTS